MKQHNRLKGDLVIWGIILLLISIGVLAVYSASGSLAYRKMQGNTEYYLFKHSSLVIVGIIAIWTAHKINYRYYTGISIIGLYISVPLLLITWKYGINLNEASRWLNIPFMNKSFQPSDLAQLSLIAELAKVVSKRKNKKSEEGMFTIMIWCIVISGLIAVANLSTAILLFFTCLVIMFIGNVPIKYILTLLIVATLSGTIVISFSQRSKTALARIENFKTGKLSFQTKQSYMAIASGGLYGKGPGNSHQKHFLPHPYSDFIYAILIEEYGIIGGIVVILLYLALLYRGIANIIYSKFLYGGLLSTGLSLSITLQALMNIGVVLGIGPVTGIPLPLVSMGGTSMIFTGISLGIILSVSRNPSG